MWRLPGMCSASYSETSRTSTITGPSGADLRRACAAGSQPARGARFARLALVDVVGGDDDQLGGGRRDPRDLGGEAGVVGGGAERAGDVGLVELLVGAAVDDDRPGGDRFLDLEGGHRQ